MATPVGNPDDVIQKFQDALRHSFTNNGLDRDKAHELLQLLSELLAHVRVLREALVTSNKAFHEMNQKHTDAVALLQSKDETIAALKAELARRDSMYPPFRPMTDDQVKFEIFSDPHLSAEEFSKMVAEHNQTCE